LDEKKADSLVLIVAFSKPALVTEFHDKAGNYIEIKLPSFAHFMLLVQKMRVNIINI
jgi:hypothetical protein